MQEQRRNRGYGRALLESIEEVARFLNVPRLLLCSTDDHDTKVRCQAHGLGLCRVLGID